MVESVLVLLAFLILILGIIDIGQLFYSRTALTGQLRVVARRAAIESMDDVEIRRALAPHRVEIARTPGKLTIALANIQIPSVTPWLGGLIPGGQSIAQTVAIAQRP